jgi:type VI secretion system secreted protein Hcp
MAVDYFLKIDGVDGESKDATHGGELELLSWSWGESNSGSSSLGTGLGAGKVDMSDFTFMIYTMKGSPKLQEKCATGEHIASAILTCRKAGGEGQEYMTYTFSDLIVSSFQISGSSENPTEAISFNFTKIQQKYRPQDEKGQLGDNIEWGYDLKANQKV